MSRSRSSDDEEKQALLTPTTGLRRRGLLAAAATGSPDEVRDLLAAGITRRQNNIVCQALCRALQSGRDRTARRIVETKGFIPAFSEEYKKDPLHIAIVSEHLKGAALLIIDKLQQQEDGIDYLNRQDNTHCTAIHYAAMHGSALTGKLLAIPGIDYRKKDKQERTPLDSTAAARRANVVKMLLERGGTNIFADDPDYLSRPLFLAIKPSGSADNERTIYPVLEALMHAGADPSRIGSKGSTYVAQPHEPPTTPISLAINHGFSNITQLFIESKEESVTSYLRDNAENLMTSAVELEFPHTANVLMQHEVFKEFLQEPGIKKNG